MQRPRGKSSSAIAGTRVVEWSGRPPWLQLDESRIGEADEAWVPVITPDGPGVLVWLNSD
ncbi:DUF6210 family protein [Kitasatospora sp. NPDC085464]|uniref:DUF6210 family protein n=1 Tax=Kitasatospora sp. NPDC085464 TaxID=3364063 RepID=UPI0037CBAF39